MRALFANWRTLAHRLPLPWQAAEQIASSVILFFSLLRLQQLMKKTLVLLAALAFATAGTSFAQTAVKTTGSDANATARHYQKGPKDPAKMGRPPGRQNGQRAWP